MHSLATAWVGVTQMKWLCRLKPVKALSHGGVPLELVWNADKCLIGPDSGGSSSAWEAPGPAVRADKRQQYSAINISDFPLLFICFQVKSCADESVLSVVTHTKSAVTETSVCQSNCPCPHAIQTHSMCVCVRESERVTERILVNRWKPHVRFKSS